MTATAKTRGLTRLTDEEWATFEANKGLAYNIAINTKACRLDEEGRLAEALRNAFASLPGRFREVAEAVLVDGEPDVRLAARYGVSRERIHQLKSVALDKLRNHPALAAHAKGG